MTPAKVDDNQKEIVGALRKIPGVKVEVGHDDILVGRRVLGIKRTFWFEIKNPDAISKKTNKVLRGAIKPSQRILLDTFTGHYSIVWKLDQILKEIGLEA